ncbi:MAG: hypothetical protein F6K32_02860 [Desertifilum sp. SIO1I2]|nr:hypothetical protein [Desertifilum sp. SIO1I2]
MLAVFGKEDMLDPMRVKSYTKIARWYNLICLILMMFSSIIFLVFAARGVYGDNISAIEMFPSVITGLAVFIGIVGIIYEKLWVKWLILATYSIYIFGAIEGLVNSFSTEPAFQLLGDSNMSIALKIGRLIAIAVLSVGIILLFKKPNSGQTSEGRE